MCPARAPGTAREGARAPVFTLRTAWLRLRGCLKSGTGILPVGPVGVPPAGFSAGRMPASPTEEEEGNREGRMMGEPAGPAVPLFRRPLNMDRVAGGDFHGFPHAFAQRGV